MSAHFASVRIEVSTWRARLRIAWARLTGRAVDPVELLHLCRWRIVDGKFDRGWRRLP